MVVITRAELESVTESDSVDESFVVRPQQHYVFDDIFSTVWSDGDFDPLVWDYLVQRVNRHCTVEPDSYIHVTLPNDFSTFAPDIPAPGCPFSKISSAGPLPFAQN